MAAIDTVHDLQGAETRSFNGALFQPTHEMLGLVRHPQAQEGVQSKRRVADPGVAVVPVARAADLFGEAARWCCNYRPGWREGQHLQHEDRTVDRAAGPLREAKNKRKNDSKHNRNISSQSSE